MPFCKLRAVFILYATIVLSLVVQVSASQVNPVAPGELVRRAVESEISANNAKIKYMFQSDKKVPNGSQTRLFVQTREGTVGMTVANNDQLLTVEQHHGEMYRINRFLKDPDELKKKQKQEKDDADRVTRIIRALPDAFIYEYDGGEMGATGMGKAGVELVRLKLRPNPQYDAPSRVEQILTGMQGYILIDTAKNRIARISGTLVKEVSFGWGILGHLDRGGRITISQGDVGGGNWTITAIDMGFTGKVLFFKNVNVQSTESYNNFKPVTDMSYAEGIELIKKQEALFNKNWQKKNIPSK